MNNYKLQVIRACCLELIFDIEFGISDPHKIDLEELVIANEKLMEANKWPMLWRVDECLDFLTDLEYPNNGKNYQNFPERLSTDPPGDQKLLNPAGG